MSMYKAISSYYSKLKQQNRTTVVIKQAFYSLSLKGVSVIISFLYVPLLLTYLNSEKYGIWLTIVSILNWISLFDIGLGNGLRNKLTEAIAKKDFELGRKYVSTTYALMGGISIILFLAFHIANLYIPWNNVLNTKMIPAAELVLLTSVVFSITILRFFIQLIGVIYLAYQKSSMNDLIVTISSLISLACVWQVSILLPPGNIVLLALIITLIPVLTYLAFTIIAFSTIFKEIRPSIKYVRMNFAKPLFVLSSRFFLMQITALIIYSSANIMIVNLFNPHEVIVYNIAFTLFGGTIMIMRICLSPVWSSVTDAYAAGDFNFLNKMMRRLNYLSLIFSIGVVLLLSVSELFYELWLKGKVHVPFKLSLAMAIYAIIYMFQAPYSMYINGFGKLKITVALTLLGIAVYFAGAILLSKYLNSSAGVILAIALTSIIGLTMQGIQVKKLLNRKATGWWNI